MLQSWYFAFFEDRFTKLEDYEYKYTLESGTYEVGVELPAGTYVVKMEGADETEINIYKEEESQVYYQKRYYVYDNKKGEKDIIKQPYGGISIRGVGGSSVLFQKRIKNITLEEGQILEIAPEISFIFYSHTAKNTN